MRDPEKIKQYLIFISTTVYYCTFLLLTAWSTYSVVNYYKSYVDRKLRCLEFLKSI